MNDRHDNSDLYGSGHGHRKHHEPEAPTIHENVPTWAVVIFENTERIIQELRNMKQSTSDLIAVVNDLVSNAKSVDDAIEALVAAKEDDDDAAINSAIGNLKTLKADQDSHLSKLTTAVPPVVAAPADPAPVTITPPAA